jgi:hypothetical protein
MACNVPLTASASCYCARYDDGSAIASYTPNTLREENPTHTHGKRD